jgi:hypothetical protein
MKTLKRFVGPFCLLIFTVSCCEAQSAHELHVGAQEEQVCTAPLIETVSNFLNVPDIVLKYQVGEPSSSVLVAAACKVNPAVPRETFVAIAYDGGEEYEKNLVLAAVDTSRNRVIADYRGRIDEDAALRVESGSLWIDTAAYMLAPGVRAFGLDVTSGYTPNCGDGGLGAQRSLYVREGKHIRPVLQYIYMSSWQFIQRGQDRCNSPADPKTRAIIEYTNLTLSIGPGLSHGYHDLRVTASSYRDDGEPSGAPLRHHVLHYDGKTYPVPPDL